MPLILQADGKAKAYRRVTNFVKVLDDTASITLWKQRRTMEGLVRRPDLYSRVGQLIDPENKEALNEIAEQALEAGGGNRASSRGTKVHLLTEFADQGLSVAGATDDEATDLMAYSYTMEFSGIQNLMIECFLVNDELGVAGTADRLLAHPDWPLNVIGDLKTSSSSRYHHAWAMQMAVYANSQLYDVATGERTPLPDVDLTRALLIHLPAGQAECALHWLDIKAGWEAVEMARQVHEWRKRKDLISSF